MLIYAIDTFMSKKKVLYDFPQKCFKTIERHSLAVVAQFVEKKVRVNIYLLLLVRSKTVV